MKKVLYTAILAITGFGATACSVDTHYDSVSTELVLSVSDMSFDGKPITVRERFQFDRDLSNVQSMTLEEAWLTSPVSSVAQILEGNTNIEDKYSLNIIKTIVVKIVKSEETSIEWLLIPTDQLKEKTAMFSPFQVGDLRDFMDASQQLELEVEIALEPYYVMSYWRDTCNMSSTCNITFPLSMQFKIED